MGRKHPPGFDCQTSACVRCSINRNAGIFLPLVENVSSPYARYISHEQQHLYSGLVLSIFLLLRASY